MGWFLIVFGLLLLLLLGVAWWAFCYTFKRGHNDVLALLENTDHFLYPYSNMIRENMERIDAAPHTDVAVTSFDGLTLTARLYPSDGARGAIAVFHGYRSTSLRDYACAVDMYRGFGFDVLMVNQRCADTSEGDVITFGVKERHDAVTWARFLSERYKDKPLFLSGLSMGAATVMMATALPLPETVRGIVADSGFTTPAAIIGTVAERDFHLPRQVVLPFLNAVSRLFGGFGLYEADALDALKQNRIPMLFVHGENDSFVPCDMSRRAFETCAAEKRLITVPGAEHGCGYLVEPERLTNALGDFFNQYA